MTFQRQVYTQQARTAEEVSRRNVHAVTKGFIWAGQDQIGWIENSDVFSVMTKEKFATIDENGNLYTLEGESLNLHLESVNGGGRTRAESHPDAIAKFRNLASGSAS